MLAAPLAVTLLGLVLLFSPDSASALISAILGWAFLAVGICMGIPVLKSGARQFMQLILPACLVVVGICLISSPLLLSQLLSRVAGALILFRYLPEAVRAHRSGQKVPAKTIAFCVAGILLILLPMAASRLFFKLCGLILAAFGAGWFYDRLKERKQLPDGEKPPIVDADE